MHKFFIKINNFQIFTATIFCSIITNVALGRARTSSLLHRGSVAREYVWKQHQKFLPSAQWSSKILSFLSSERTSIGRSHEFFERGSRFLCHDTRRKIWPEAAWHQIKIKCSGMRCPRAVLWSATLGTAAAIGICAVWLKKKDGVIKNKPVENPESVHMSIKEDQAFNANKGEAPLRPSADRPGLLEPRADQVNSGRTDAATASPILESNMGAFPNENIVAGKNDHQPYEEKTGPLTRSAIITTASQIEVGEEVPAKRDLQTAEEAEPKENECPNSVPHRKFQGLHDIMKGVHRVNQKNEKKRSEEMNAQRPKVVDLKPPAPNEQSRPRQDNKENKEDRSQAVASPPSRVSYEDFRRRTVKSRKQ